MKKDIEWFKKQIISNYPSQGEVDNPDYEVIAKVRIIDEVLSLVDKLGKPELPVIPQFVADYLSNVDVYSFEERIEILVNSHSGDSYYFHEMLPKDGHISYELGDQLYEYAQNENLKKLFQLINGYTIEKEPQWVVKDDTGYLSYLQFSIPNIYERETSLDKNDAYKFNSKSKADLVADLVDGEVVEVPNE